MLKIFLIQQVLQHLHSKQYKHLQMVIKYLIILGYWGIRNIILRNDRLSLDTSLTYSKDNDLRGW